MIKNYCALVVLALCALAYRSSAIDCVPKSVANMTVDTDHYLSWSTRVGEECNVTSYIVHIFRLNQVEEYIFTVHLQYIDISFLDVCDEWTFIVIPISNETMVGPQMRIVSSLPLPTDANLTISSLGLLTTHLFWELADNRYGSCNLRYRVTIEENFSPIIDDIYTTEKFLNLDFLAPCTEYTFGVRAINTFHPVIEGPLKTATYNFEAIEQGPPALVSVQTTATVLNLSYRLESFIRNPCPVRELSIDGGSFFNQTVAIQDTPLRPLVNLTVDSLNPNSMYILRAYVHNSGGWSKAAVVGIQTPDLDPGKA